jgi:hypothetical protein
LTQLEKTHAGQSDVNLALLNLIKLYGDCSYAMLFDQFANLTIKPEEAHNKFAKKLSYMLYHEQLQCNGRGRARRFWLGPMAGKRPLGAKETAAPDRYTAARRIAPADSYLPTAPTATVVDASLADAYPGPVVPPRQHNTMTAPIYVPPPNPAMRPGALDYQRYASRGFRC